MAIYTSESRERVREAADFVEIVSAHTELRRSGPARYEGLCPFHEERTPSFGIDPQRKLYHCFGCGASGDLFTFVQETEQVGFREALELLAERYGVALEREQENPRMVARREQRARLYALLERACAFYERRLRDSEAGAKARAYLRERGLGEEICETFRVGLAPDRPQAIVRG
jgi:DNA primase